MSNRAFDILVIGGGHAAIEAALIASRRGLSVAMLTFSASTIGEMSCNPSIGGLGKGQLVKELDALGGEMALAIDETGIQFRLLNSSKGPAVRSSRAQADRLLYRERMRRALCEASPVKVIEAAAESVFLERGRLAGVRTEDAVTIKARAVVVTTGTFLSGLMHTGEMKTCGGRCGERASDRLSESLRSLGLRLGRLKTGTPPRILASSIDYSRLTCQPGMTPISPFSFRTASIDRPQVPCWITRTSERTHEIIAASRERSPLFNGQIKGTGPRYCPSIEDKVFRFRDKTSHTIFLEPEGLTSPLVYPNGIATSLPVDVQDAFVRSIAGLENAEIARYGYAVEYDYVDPTELEPTLAWRELPGLYFAGQINGTSGYEEAAAQGIIAGINAASHVLGQEPLRLGRHEAYIGVMIDDLTTRGVLEPYRMFTSRAEYRLHLREDNAVARLMPIARRLGTIGNKEWKAFCEQEERLEREHRRLEQETAKPNDETNEWLAELESAELEDSLSLRALLRRPEMSYEALTMRYPPEAALSRLEAQRLETEVKFEGYLERERRDIERLRRMEEVVIPESFDFEAVTGLRAEIRQRLCEIRPATLGQASRISGVTPAAVSVLGIYLKRCVRPCL